MSAPSVLIIGCGSIGERHLRCFQATGRVTVTGCDANPALLRHVGDTYRVETVADWETAVGRGGFDAAVVSTPAPLHVPMAVRALEAGLHVLIEKPLSHSMEGVDALVRARDASGRQAAVAYVYRIFPAFAAARRYLESGVLGPILQAGVVSGQPFHRLRPGYANTYYCDHRTGGGAIQDALTHLANWIECVLGPTESVLCDHAHLALPGVTVEDTAHVLARNGGALVAYTLNQFQSANETTVQLNAMAGSVRIESHRQRWGVFREGDSDWTWHDELVSGRDAHFIAQANAFLDQIETDRVSLCTLEEAVQTLRFNLAALASAASGRRVCCS